MSVVFIMLLSVDLKFHSLMWKAWNRPKYTNNTKRVWFFHFIWIILFVKLNFFFFGMWVGWGFLFVFLLLMDFLVCFWLGRLSLYLDSSPSLFILFLPYFFLFLFFSRKQHSNEKLSTFLFNRQFTPWWDMLSLIFLWHSSI